VPAAVHAAIAQQEARFPDASTWTLTWLEGRPQCALDDLLVVTLDGVRLSDDPRAAAADDDDWLN